MGMKAFLAATAVGLCLAVPLAGVAHAQTPRDTVVMAKQIDDIISMDPAESFEFSGSEALGNIYDKLLTFNVKNVSEIRGQLAQTWSVADDGKTYTFKLRPDAKFHSGAPVTAQDAAYSCSAPSSSTNRRASSWRSSASPRTTPRTRSRRTDAQTLVIETDKAVAPTFFYYCLTATVASVVEMKVVAANEKAGDFGNDWLKTNSAASGPYKLRSWRANESYTLDANESYWGGAPKNKRVVVRHIKEAASQRLLLEKGDVDYARNLNKDQLDGMAGNAAIKIDRGLKGSILYMGLNQKNPILAKPEVREALKWLTDYDSIQKNIVSATHTTHQAFLPIGFLGATEERPYKFDLAKGKALLAKAGYPNGFSVTMDVRTTYPAQDIAQAVQGNWAQAGIKLELIPGDGKQTLTKYRARTHDIYIGQWGPDYQDPHTNAETFAMNVDNKDDAKSKTLAWRNAWDIPEMTKKTESAVLERDAKKREKIYLELQAEHMKTSPFVIMFQETEVVARRAGVDGFVIGPSFDNNFYSAIAKN